MEDYKLVISTTLIVLVLSKFVTFILPVELKIKYRE